MPPGFASRTVPDPGHDSRAQRGSRSGVSTAEAWVGLSGRDGEGRARLDPPSAGSGERAGFRDTGGRAGCPPRRRAQGQAGPMGGVRSDPYRLNDDPGLGARGVDPRPRRARRRGRDRGSAEPTAGNGQGCRITPGLRRSDEASPGRAGTGEGHRGEPHEDGDQERLERCETSVSQCCHPSRTCSHVRILQGDPPEGHGQQVRVVQPEVTRRPHQTGRDRVPIQGPWCALTPRPKALQPRALPGVVT